jgi:hypothetical protein
LTGVTRIVRFAETFATPSPASHNITVNRVGEGGRRGRRTCLHHVEDGGEGGGDAGAAHVQAVVQGVAARHGLGAVHLRVQRCR